MTSHTCDAYRFHNFEARVRTGLLLRDGQRIKIEEIPFQMLLILLERPGHVVSKEELRDRIWGEKTFGELDNSLHVAVAKLREALRGSAGSSLIETVRRRGYQFNGDVVPVFDPAPKVPSPGAPSIATRGELSGLATRSFLQIAFGLAFATLLISAFGIAVYRHTHRSLMKAGDRVILGAFANSTGDDAYSGLSKIFRVKLEESPFLSVVPERRFRQVVSEPDTASLQEQIKGCATVGGKILLTGQLLAQDNGYQVVTNAWQCLGGRLLDTLVTHADSKERILHAIDLVTDRMRRRLGEPNTSVRKFDVPLVQATTASPAALKAFLLGEERRAKGQEFESITDYKLAIDLDPKFALAYARLGTIYSNAAENELSASYYKKAFEMRERTTDRERLYITAHYYSYATGEIQRSIDAHELWHSIYPQDSTPASNLAVEYLAIGAPDKAEPMARAAVRLDPTSELADAVLARVYLETEDYKDLQKMCSDPELGKDEMMPLHQSCFLFAFVKNDTAGMQRQIQWGRGNSAEGEMEDEAAWVSMLQGRISEGWRLFAEARQSALNHKFTELAATIDLDEASLEVDLGYPAEGTQHALDALSLAPDSTSTQASAALALARAGAIRQAQDQAGKASAKAPLDTILNTAELASVRAAIQLQQQNPAAAIQALEQTRPLDLCSAMALAPAYYRGLAFLQADKAKEAAAEFRRVVDHRALAPDSPYVALAELNLGRALQHMGDRSNASVAYQDAENLWKNADPNFLPMQQLKCLRRSLAEQGASPISCGHS